MEVAPNVFRRAVDRKSINLWVGREQGLPMTKIKNREAKICSVLSFQENITVAAAFPMVPGIYKLSRSRPLPMPHPTPRLQEQQVET
jgi:hypothetical protein